MSGALARCCLWLRTHAMHAGSSWILQDPAGSGTIRHDPARSCWVNAGSLQPPLAAAVLWAAAASARHWVPAGRPAQLRCKEEWAWPVALGLRRRAPAPPAHRLQGPLLEQLPLPVSPPPPKKNNTQMLRVRGRQGQAAGGSAAGSGGRGGDGGRGRERCVGGGARVCVGGAWAGSYNSARRAKQTLEPLLSPQYPCNAAPWSAACGAQAPPPLPPSVYIGDSMTDIPAFISADVALLLGANPLVRQVAAVAGEASSVCVCVCVCGGERGGAGRPLLRGSKHWEWESTDSLCVDRAPPPPSPPPPPKTTK